MLDVRADEQYAEGHIIDARHVRGSDLESSVDSLKKYKDKAVVVYCDTGATSGAATRLLKSRGFTKVVNLRGGLQAWKQENLPVVREAGKDPCARPRVTKEPSRHEWPASRPDV